jgi:hypothetical protein
MRPLKPRRVFLGSGVALAEPQQSERLSAGEPAELIDGASNHGADPRCTFVLRFLGEGEQPFRWRCRTSWDAMRVIGEAREAAAEGDSIGPIALVTIRSRGDGRKQRRFRNYPDDHLGGDGADFGQLEEEAV